MHPETFISVLFEDRIELAFVSTSLRLPSSTASRSALTSKGNFCVINPCRKSVAALPPILKSLLFLRLERESDHVICCMRGSERVERIRCWVNLEVLKEGGLGLGEVFGD